MTLEPERTEEGDYTGLPAWYLLELLRPRLRKAARLYGVSLASAATLLCAGDSAAASHFNYVLNGKIGIVGLRVCERLLDLVGLSHRDADDAMWIPLHGIRPAVRMAGDELYAQGLALTEEALLERARDLIERRRRLLEERP